MPTVLINIVQTHITEQKIHLPLPELVFSITQLRHLRDPARRNAVWTATMNDQRADEISPVLMRNPWKVQKGPGNTEFCCKVRATRTIPKDWIKSFVRTNASFRYTGDEKVYKEKITLVLPIAYRWSRSFTWKKSTQLFVGKKTKKRGRREERKNTETEHPLKLKP